MAKKRDYSKMTKAELLEICKELGIDDAKPRFKREDLIALIESHETSKKKTSKQSRNERKKAEEATHSDKSYKERPQVHFLDNQEVEINPEVNDYDIEMALAREDQNHILTGRVGGIDSVDEYRRADGTIVKYGTLYVNFGNRRAYIPHFFFFENWEDPVRFSPKTWYQNLQNRIGSIVDFVGLPPMEDDDRYMATRFPAMRKKRRDHWYAKVAGSEEFYLDNGVIAQARICEAKEEGLVLEIEGAECFMPAKEIGNYYVPKANKKYKAGMTVFVKISNVERAAIPKNASLDNFAYPVRYDASIKDAVKDPQIAHFHEYKKDSTHLATVSQRIITKDGNVRFFCNVGIDPDVVSVYCRLLKGVTLTPKVGDEVKIRIEDGDPETHKIWGWIIHKEDLESKSNQAFAVLDIDEDDAV